MCCGCLQIGYYEDRTNKLNSYQMMIAKFGATTWVGYFYDRLEFDAGETAGAIDGIWQGDEDAAAYAGFGAGSGGAPDAQLQGLAPSRHLAAAPASPAEPKKAAAQPKKPKKKVVHRSKGEPSLRQTADILVYLNLPGSGVNAIRTELVSQFGGSAADSLPLRNGQWVWDTIHLAGCAAFGPEYKACCGQCVLSTLNCNTVIGCAVSV
jgi:hypothetical protein